MKDARVLPATSRLARSSALRSSKFRLDKVLSHSLKRRVDTELERRLWDMAGSSPTSPAPDDGRVETELIIAVSRELGARTFFKSSSVSKSSLSKSMESAKDLRRLMSSWGDELFFPAEER